MLLFKKYYKINVKYPIKEIIFVKYTRQQKNLVILTAFSS